MEDHSVGCVVMWAYQNNFFSKLYTNDNQSDSYNLQTDTLPLYIFIVIK